MNAAKFTLADSATVAAFWHCDFLFQGVVISRRAFSESCEWPRYESIARQLKY